MQVYVSMLYLIMVVITNNPVTGYKINRRFLPVVTDVWISSVGLPAAKRTKMLPPAAVM